MVSVDLEHSLVNAAFSCTRVKIGQPPLCDSDFSWCLPSDWNPSCCWRLFEGTVAAVVSWSEVTTFDHKVHRLGGRQPANCQFINLDCRHAAVDPSWLAPMSATRLRCNWGLGSTVFLYKSKIAECHFAVKLLSSSNYKPHISEVLAEFK